MVGAIERITQEIVALDRATSAIADEFYSAYLTYLTVLGQAVRQQLILASYHVCTQGYPEAFLRLSYSQRQQLQHLLRHLARQVQEEILAQLHVPVVLDDPDVDRVSLELTSSTDRQSDSALLAVEPSLVASTQIQARSLTPTHLAQWREELEHAVAAELKTASHAANRLLQQASVLPQTLPEPVLEAATKADMSDTRTGTPNLLNLMVETGGDAAETDPSEEANGESNGHAILHIIAIYLRLAEIEFADPTVAAARSKIRSLFARLKALGREYQKKRYEQSIAEAQAAWRSSWAEE